MTFTANFPFTIVVPVSSDEMGQIFFSFGDFPQEVFFSPTPMLMKALALEEILFCCHLERDWQQQYGAFFKTSTL